MAKLTKKNGRATESKSRSKSRIAEDRASNGNGAVEHVAPEKRLPVLKTYKIFIGGKFPRTESGRYYLLKGPKGDPIANMCLCSRKDFRDAVSAARKAQSSWAARSAF